MSLLKPAVMQRYISVKQVDKFWCVILKEGDGLKITASFKTQTEALAHAIRIRGWGENK
jgi:hypothetical protein